MMKKLLTALALLTITAAPGIARADLKVVATVPDLAALARTVGKGHATVKALSLPTQDPHFVDAKPSLMLDLNRADLLIAVGVSLEVGWLPSLQVGARNADIQSGARGYLDCSRHVGLLDVPRGKVSRAQGDIHPGGNPHYLYDPRRAKDCAAAIAAKMAALDPGNAAAYRANLAAFNARLAAAQKRWQGRMAARRGAHIVTYHKSFVYLADWLGFQIVDQLEPKPGIAPTPSHVVHVIQAARGQKAFALLQESYYPSRTSKLVAQKIGAHLVVIPGGTNFAGGQTYIQHMDQLIAKLAGAAR
ncbi:MAG TPA: zinc ABC transporter substrate-binding protein [Kofleriaceae bacterium]|nr:zinc ABC transporter substrate-binding protein [Kofleriaceae bacterium]